MWSMTTTVNQLQVLQSGKTPRKHYTWHIVLVQLVLSTHAIAVYKSSLGTP